MIAANPIETSFKGLKKKRAIKRETNTERNIGRKHIKVTFKFLKTVTSKINIRIEDIRLIIIISLFIDEDVSAVRPYFPANSQMIL